MAPRGRDYPADTVTGAGGSASRGWTALSRSAVAGSGKRVGMGNGVRGLLRWRVIVPPLAVAALALTEEPARHLGALGSKDRADRRMAGKWVGQ